MNSHLIEKKPTWWLLYTNGAALVGLIGLLEVSVPGAAARLILEVSAVVAISVLMLCWLRVNRGRIELAEARATRAETFGQAVQIPAPGVKIPPTSTSSQLAHVHLERGHHGHGRSKSGVVSA